MGHLQLLALFVSIAVTNSADEHDCFCNLYVQREVHSQPSTSSPILGRMYEFDCKPSATNVPESDGWAAIAFEHQLGYVQKGEKFTPSICPGPPSATDVITTTTTPSTTPSTSTTSTTTISTTTTTTTPTPTTSSTRMPTTPQRITSSTATAVKLTPSSTASTSSSTSSTTRATTMSTTTAVISGNIRLCPQILHQYTREDGGALTQYGDSCYELVPIRGIWAKAESDCRAKGGHLFHIQSQAFQDFIYRWIKSYKFDHAVWTGLTDLVNEEYFEWVSGDHLVYTNWYPDRYGNLASHHIENCVLLVPYAPYYGQWDDVQCGITTLFGDSGQQNPFICEYPLHPHHVQTGGIGLVGK